MYQYLLLVRFGLINLVCMSLLAAAYLQGWLDAILKADLVELSGAITALFVYGWIHCAIAVWRTSQELNGVDEAAPQADSHAGQYLRALELENANHEVASGVLRLRLTNRISVVRHVANSLVFLGLIGTVIGFIIALSGVDAEAASDAERVGGIISNLISGMSVALNTTLVGAVLYVWLIVNHRLLTTGTVKLLTATLELGQVRK
jgi:biopolymer transport protein ExbB/TolQ